MCQDVEVQWTLTANEVRGPWAAPQFPSVLGTLCSLCYETAVMIAARLGRNYCKSCNFYNESQVLTRGCNNILSTSTAPHKKPLRSELFSIKLLDNLLLKQSESFLERLK